MDTQILKQAQDIWSGDKILGKDGRDYEVLHTIAGSDDMLGGVIELCTRAVGSHDSHWYTVKQYQKFWIRA